MYSRKFKIALISPPISLHKSRGTGFYTDNLYKFLKKENSLEVSLLDFNSDLSEFDLIHYPYFDPFFLTLPLIKRKPVVVTVHDLIPLKFSKYFPKGIRGSFRWFIQKISLKGAKIIITDSQASKKDIIELTGINFDKIRVIYLGVDEDYMIIKDSKKLDQVRKKYHLPENYILNVGDVNYNKNISGLIKAFHRTRQQNNNLNLVLVGNGFVNPSVELSKLLELIRRLNLTNQILRIGYIPKEDLLSIYNQATLYIQISIAEGFGLPVLEAMVSGCPVIVSNISSLPELVGDSAILVDPYEYDKLGVIIADLLVDEEKRIGLIKKGLERVKEFSWKRSAFQTCRVYKEVLSSL